MSRHYGIIDKDLFIEKVEKIISHDDFPENLTTTIEKDLSKVEFAWENYTPFIGWTKSYGNFGLYPVGYKEIAKDFHIYYMNAGGDWEYPICFCFYWDGSQIRAYIPKGGNVYNKKENSAYGNNDDGEEDEEGNEMNHEKEFDLELMEKDILNRIKLK